MIRSSKNVFVPLVSLTPLSFRLTLEAQLKIFRSSGCSFFHSAFFARAECCATSGWNDAHLSILVSTLDRTAAQNVRSPTFMVIRSFDDHFISSPCSHPQARKWPLVTASRPFGSSCWVGVGFFYPFPRIPLTSSVSVTVLAIDGDVVRRDVPLNPIRQNNREDAVSAEDSTSVEDTRWLLISPSSQCSESLAKRRKMAIRFPNVRIVSAAVNTAFVSSRSPANSNPRPVTASSTVFRGISLVASARPVEPCDLPIPPAVCMKRP